MSRFFFFFRKFTIGHSPQSILSQPRLDLSNAGKAMTEVSVQRLGQKLGHTNGKTEMIETASQAHNEVPTSLSMKPSTTSTHPPTHSSSDPKSLDHSPHNVLTSRTTEIPPRMLPMKPQLSVPQPPHTTFLIALQSSSVCQANSSPKSSSCHTSPPLRDLPHHPDIPLHELHLQRARPPRVWPGWLLSTA